ncbi:glutamate 5-kinase [Mucisphaera calidilacus]|uniref:Glutamate 5-kinase n=1 Tax=Mucisphaera calidilacus TaxID=2527982 RepID=A0A518BZU8_9BACT|nr:glutamate 5-kinase [Mucisphaera calidilacus]QDU72495.1 Glutamate 5-kinase [Mucisphaera calidilacus]
MPSSSLRRERLVPARHLVVKVGTALLTRDADEGPGLDTEFIAALAKQIGTLSKQGYEITLVSSGAVGAGCVELGVEKRPEDVAELQAAAAVGQRRLMTHLHDALKPYGLRVGQLLLTRHDFDDRERFLNIRNCVTKLHELGCLPVLNENDSVAVDEIRFGDNDLLAALTTNALAAEALILLTTVDGLLDDDGKVVDLVENIQEQIGLVRTEGSSWGRGGMSTKLESARLVTEAGEVAVIAHGREKNVLLRLMKGEKLGTCFLPSERKLDSRSRWIGLTKRPDGTLSVDTGASAAVVDNGKSLLAKGITDVTGRFERGSLVVVRDPQGREIGRGLINYNSDETRSIMGLDSDRFAERLGRPGFTEVIHRDNLVVMASTATH